jgi:hypothetical protein
MTEYFLNGKRYHCYPIRKVTPELIRSYVGAGWTQFCHGVFVANTDLPSHHRPYV